MPKGVAKSGKRKCSPRVARVTISCVVCGSSRTILPSMAARLTGKYCSKRCAAAVMVKPMTHVSLNCASCGIAVVKDAHRVKKTTYCSRTCAAAGRRVDGAKWKDPAQIKAYMAEYVRKNREKHNARNRDWIKRNRDKRNALQRARRGAGGMVSPEEWAGLVEKFKSLCVCCLERKPLQFDHVKAVSRGGLTVLDNAQPLCAPCNIRKSNREIDYRDTFLDRLLVRTQNWR